MIGISFAHLDPKVPIMVLPGIFGPSRYSIESSICDNMKHQKRCSEVSFFLECVLITYIMAIFIVLNKAYVHINPNLVSV